MLKMCFLLRNELLEQPRNSEAVCLRLGLQLSQSASAMEMGAAALEALSQQGLAESHWKCFQEMATYLATSKGQEMVAAATVLNKGNDGPKDENEMSAAIGQWLHGLDGLRQKEKSVRKTARLSARTYLWTMDMLEQLAMYQHPDVFFDGIDDNNELLAIHALETLAKAPAVKTLHKAMEAADTKQILSKTAGKEKDALSTSDASEHASRAPRKRKRKASSSRSRSCSTPKRGRARSSKPAKALMPKKANVGTPWKWHRQKGQEGQDKEEEEENILRGMANVSVPLLVRHLKSLSVERLDSLHEIFGGCGCDDATLRFIQDCSRAMSMSWSRHCMHLGLYVIHGRDLSEVMVFCQVHFEQL